MVRTVYVHKRNPHNIAHGNTWLSNFNGQCVSGYDESNVEVVKGFILLVLKDKNQYTM